VTAAELKAMLDSGADDFQVISVRAPDAYTVGHVQGAINIPMAQLATTESLSKIDPDKKVVVYCYQGHTSQQVQFFLSQLGYDVVGLQHGMSSWTNDAAVRANKTYNPADVPNLPTVK
jgi:rhodanese-related sulfurtransferase